MTLFYRRTGTKDDASKPRGAADVVSEHHMFFTVAAMISMAAFRPFWKRAGD